MPTHNKGTSVHCAVTLWLWQDIRCVELACSWSGSERSGSLQGPRLLHKTCAKHSSRASGLEVRKTRARNLETCGRGEGEGEGRGREGKGGEGRGRERKGGEGGTSGQVASRPGRSRIQIGDLQFRILLCQKSQKTEGKKKKT